ILDVRVLDTCVLDTRPLLVKRFGIARQPGLPRRPLGLGRDFFRSGSHGFFGPRLTAWRGMGLPTRGLPNRRSGALWRVVCFALPRLWAPWPDWGTRLSIVIDH